jgi:magnesium transporter
VKIDAVLYDANRADKKIEIDDLGSEALRDNKLLWVDIWERNAETLASVVEQLKIENVPCETIIAESPRPRLANFEDFFHFSVDSIATTENEAPQKLPIDFLVGANFVITVHNDRVKYFDEFRNRENGETQFGALDAESFVAALMDRHIVSYFRGIEYIESQVDDLDDKVIDREISTDDFLAEMVKLRRSVSALRTWLLPHRDLIYTFSRSDFTRIHESGSVEQFQLLSQHFESAVDGVEAAREKVLGTFSLYATKSDQIMNLFVQRLTFVALVVGGLGVVAGALGMNFQASIFESPVGFWIAIALMIAFSIVVTIYAKWKKWI